MKVTGVAWDASTTLLLVVTFIYVMANVPIQLENIHDWADRPHMLSFSLISSICGLNK